MKCPDCGASETIRDSGEIYCKKCGLELEDTILYDRQYKPRSTAEKIITIPLLNFHIDAKKELYALKLGLKYKKLDPDWSKYLGFTLKNNYVKPEIKKQVFRLVEKALEKNKGQLEESKNFMEKSWQTINDAYWRKIEKVLDYSWQSNEYDCYLSLVCNGGFHNSANDFIIVQHRWRKHSNYVIAHELFHIIFRKYLTEVFMKKYDEYDEALSEAIVNFVLLDELKVFPCINFSFETYGLDKHKAIAQKLWPIWKARESFKDFMKKAYGVLDREKICSK